MEEFRYVFERNYKGDFRVVKITLKEAKTCPLRTFASEQEAWDYLTKNPPVN